MPSNMPMAVAMTSDSTNVTSVCLTPAKSPLDASDAVCVAHCEGGGKNTAWWARPMSSQMTSSAIRGRRPRSGATDRRLRAVPRSRNPGSRCGLRGAAAAAGDWTSIAIALPPGFGEVEAGCEPAIGQGQQRVQDDPDHAGQQDVGEHRGGLHLLLRVDERVADTVRVADDLR